MHTTHTPGYSVDAYKRRTWQVTHPDNGIIAVTVYKVGAETVAAALNQMAQRIVQLEAQLAQQQIPNP